MINATDLRIGNAVFKKDALINGSDIQIKERLHLITAYDIYHIIEDGDPTNHPIPLNPEWLERCGFNQVETIQRNQYEVEERYTIRTDETNISYGFVTETYGGDPEKRTRFRFSEYTIDVLKAIRFVHQLQNLYFALTGEELTIKN